MRTMLTHKCCMIACLNFLMTLHSVITENNCEEREKSLLSLNIAEDLITKTKNLLPNCTDVAINTSECGEKERVSAHLDMAKKLISDAKENYPTCIGPNPKDPDTKQPVTKTPEIKEPVTEEPETMDYPIDCSEVLQNGQNVSGVYTIWPNNSLFPNLSLQVFCDMDTDGGGWTVIQRRGNFTPQEDFYRDWNDYKIGFGNVSRDFWLGNDNIFILSNQGNYKIRFDLKSVEGEKAYAVYNTFWIDYEQSIYKLHITNYTGNAGDSMDYHNKQPFSTKDRKNDMSYEGCVISGKGGWWYRLCATVNLNADYAPGNKYKSIEWRDWKEDVGIAATEIKLKSL